MHKNRNEIKWAPFNSVINSKELLQSVDKSNITMPVLSEEQKNNIEKKLITSFYEKSFVTITYFYDGKINTTKEKIKKIDFVFHKIYLNQITILFDQIITLK